MTDPAGKEGTTTLPITAGNTRPEVSFAEPVDGGFIDWGDEIDWDVDVTDAEGGVDPSRITVIPGLGHDNHDHPTVAQSGPTGSVVTDLGGGHSEDMKVFFTLKADYADTGAPGAPALTGSDLLVLQPKHKEAEHAENLQGADGRRGERRRRRRRPGPDRPRRRRPRRLRPGQPDGNRRAALPRGLRRRPAAASSCARTRRTASCSAPPRSRRRAGPTAGPT